MNPNPENLKTLFDGYLRGSLSKNEESKLADWIKSSVENYQTFKAYLSDIQFSQPTTEESNAAWMYLRNRIQPRAPRKILMPALPQWAKIAALLIVGLLGGILANQYLRSEKYADAINQVIVPYGEKATLILSDGTVVYLNAGTQFSYPSQFSKNYREVSLSGEAFFDVTKNESHPFLIRAPHFNVKVTGTSFNLNTYQKDEENSLTLHSGEVFIENEGREFRVHPGEKYVFNTLSQESKINPTDLKKSFLWKDGFIVVDNLTLEEIRKLLERKFDVSIIIQSEELRKLRYSGQFKSNETLTDILEVIKKVSTKKFIYEINKTNKTVIVK